MMKYEIAEKAKKYLGTYFIMANCIAYLYWKQVHLVLVVLNGIPHLLCRIEIGNNFEALTQWGKDIE